LTSSKSKTPATKEKPNKKHKYRLMFLPEALEEFRSLDGSVREVLKKLLAKRLDNPREPGGELSGDLAHCYKVKLVKQGIRLVYQVENDQLTVLVQAVDKREDSLAYKSAVARLVRGAVALKKASGKT